MSLVHYRTVCLSVIRFAKLKSIYRDPERPCLLKTDTSDFSVVKCTAPNGLRGVYPKFQTDSTHHTKPSISSRDRTLFQVWLKAAQTVQAMRASSRPEQRSEPSSRVHAKAGPHESHQPLTKRRAQSTEYIVARFTLVLEVSQLSAKTCCAGHPINRSRSSSTIPSTKSRMDALEFLKERKRLQRLRWLPAWRNSLCP